MTNNELVSEVSSSSPERIIDPMISKHFPGFLDTRLPGSFFPNPKHDAPSNFMTWPYIVQILSHGDLDQLFRDPVCDTAYRTFAPPVRKQYGGMENYIRTARLGWPAEVDSAPSGPNMLDKPPKDPLSIMSLASSASGSFVSAPGSRMSTPTGRVSTPNGTPRIPVEVIKETWPEKVLAHPNKPGIKLKHFVHDADIDGEHAECLVKTIPNDWPYGVPSGSSHWVVWSKLPILHPSLFENFETPFPVETRDDLYNCVTGDGIRGFTGFLPESDANPTYHFQGEVIPEVLGSYSQSKLAEASEKGELAGLSRESISRAHAWASREVTKYIEKVWPADRYQTAWFCNPPHLRTVPSLSHFQ
ncbi:uncharacterized protein MEPE_04396 [Melanopsichium pennsylvanicum]|uniref:Uncharacterized protein n=2 Tax=Melanopsichium pennsylvanicum TaxID=63383 RepID=A0AAJ4XNX7_9BASI|nr:conserved hypothetical protein [Melanopsichium pennsylvanicum 4]SNX85687.1 uncharacterized protein MEPE_04396 [Melanopsichium pennsylvanicum]